MIPPQCGMLAIGGLPMTLPGPDHLCDLRVGVELLAEVLPESGGIVLSSESGFGTPPRPLGPWQLMQPSRT